MRCLFSTALVGWLAFMANTAWAVEPTLRTINIRGLHIGGTTTIVVDGDDFGKTPKLLLPFTITQTLKTGSTEKQATFEVTVPADVPAGYANLQLATEGGVSLPVVIALDRMPQRLATASVEQLPVALTGAVSGSTSSEIVVPCKAGQAVMVEVEAQRLGSKLRPVVHVYSPKKTQLKWSWGTPALGGDTRLEFTPKEDGLHTIAIHDAEYAAGNPSFYRVKVGRWAYIDQVFPPVTGPQARDIELIGSAVLKTNAPASAVLQPLPWPDGQVWSGPRPFVVRSRHIEVLEQPSGKPQELPTGRVGVSGKLVTPNEEDVYRVPVTPKSKVKLEVVAERLGSALDVALVVRNDMGADLARAEDSPNTLDPALEYTVPDQVTSILVAVQDAAGRGNARGIYRFTITPSTANAVDDFELFTLAKRIPLAGKTILPVLVERRGYDGPITLSATGLPNGVKLDNTQIPAKANGTLLVVDSPPQATANIITLRGIADDKQERLVVLRGHPLEDAQPWLANEIPYATPTKPADFSIDWRGFPADAPLLPVNKLNLPITVKRPADGPVRLTLLTSQNPPLANRQPDPNRTIRVEKPVELAAKVNDGAIDALVPAELPSPVYDLVVQAELLSPDKAKVLATAFTPVRRLTVRQPFTIKLASSTIPAKRDPKTGLTADVVGEITRDASFKGDVVLALTGLPAGARITPTTVKADATKFTLPIIFAPTQAVGEARGMLLSGSAVPDAKQPNARVKAPEMPIVVTIPPVPEVPKKK